MLCQFFVLISAISSPHFSCFYGSFSFVAIQHKSFNIKPPSSLNIVMFQKCSLQESQLPLQGPGHSTGRRTVTDRSCDCSTFVSAMVNITALDLFLLDSTLWYLPFFLQLQHFCQTDYYNTPFMSFWRFDSVLPGTNSRLLEASRWSKMQQPKVFVINENKLLTNHIIIFHAEEDEKLWQEGAKESVCVAIFYYRFYHAVRDKQKRRRRLTDQLRQFNGFLSKHAEVFLSLSYKNYKPLLFSTKHHKLKQICAEFPDFEHSLRAARLTAQSVDQDRNQKEDNIFHKRKRIEVEKSQWCKWWNNCLKSEKNNVSVHLILYS